MSCESIDIVCQRQDDGTNFLMEQRHRPNSEQKLDEMQVSPVNAKRLLGEDYCFGGSIAVGSSVIFFHRFGTNDTPSFPIGLI